MHIYSRILDLPSLLEKKSFFLFGPRGAGKSFLIRQSFGDDTLVINLLKTTLQLRLGRNPSALEEIIDAFGPTPPRLVVIDEVQKLPILLDEVHRLIEERGLRFLLTGSSARRLKAGGVNLLAGRARIAELFPLCYPELADFDLDRYLRYGSLPAVWQSPEPEEELEAYTQTYLREEIQAEGFVRKIPAFADFLRAAALSSGHVLNYSSLAQEAGVSVPTIRSYYQILEDTLLGFSVPPWQKSMRRKPISTSKFYLFDTGVLNTLAGTQHVDRNSNLYGALFEHFIALELRAWKSYHRSNKTLYFWRTEDKHEVDFIWQDNTAIEVKSTQKVSNNDLKNIKVLQQEQQLEHYIVVSNDPIDRVQEGIQLLHWKTFLQKLWSTSLQGR